MVGVHAQIIDRLLASSVPFAIVVAPGGFGETHLARAYAARFAQSAFVSATAGASADCVLERIASAFRDKPDCLVLDSVETLDADILRIALEALVALRPDGTAVMVCGREEPFAFQFSDVIAPHLLTVLRRADIELTLEELKSHVPAGASVGMDAIYRVHYLTRGWPVPALSLLQTTIRGAFDSDPIALDHPALNDLFDWLEANALHALPPDLRQMLFRCVACRDTTQSDFPHPHGSGLGGDDRRLTRGFQLADIGLTGELRVHPLLAYFLRARHADELERTAREAAVTFVEGGKSIRAVRALIGAGCVTEAAAILDSTDFDEARHLGGYSYPGLGLEFFSRTKPLYKHPLMWLNLIPCRSYVVPPATLAREGADLLELTYARLSTRARYWITAAIAILFVEAGDLAAAERYALEIVEPIDGDIETTMSYEVAAMHIDVGNGRYRSALERWRRAGPYLQRFPTWYALHVRAAIAAAFGFGDLAAGEEALRTLLSLARVGGCPSLAAFGAMLGAFLAWYKSDSRSLVKYRSEFARIAQYYDIPLLWRCLASLFGVDLEERDSYPLHDAYADLILALDGAAGARSADLIRRAVASANAAANPLLRAIARFSAIECGDSMTDELRREVVEIADSTDSDKLKESVRAACAGQSEVGLLQPLLDRLRNRAVEAPAAVAVDTPAAVAAVTGSFGIDVATGEVLRAGVPVRVSDGTLQLLVFFAVTGRPVGRDTIVDRMWPDLDGDSAVNALKMCVHRARVQLESSEAITSRKGSYALGDNVTTTYQHILDLAGAAQSRTLTDETRKELPGVYERLSRGLMAGWAAWTWFVPYTRVLTDAMRSIAKHLVLEQIERGEFQLAQQNARTMIDVEFFDESARMLLLQVYMGMGNRKAALCEYREYSNLLERELGELPSPSLQRLVGA